MAKLREQGAISMSVEVMNTSRYNETSNSGPEDDLCTTDKSYPPN